MKPTKEQLDAYKEMASSSQGTMCDIIKAHLVENCQKYDEALFDRCIQHLYDTVLEMLGGQEAAVDNKLSGKVPADTCFRICRDYYNDEIWKKEDEEAAAEKAEQDKREMERKAKENKRKAAEKAKHEKEQAKKDQQNLLSDCDVPKTEQKTINPPPLKEIKAPDAPEPGQLDFFAMMGA